MPGIPPARYAYLGPPGSFCEAALRQLPAAARATLQPAASVTAALDDVRRGDADGALVPLENSVEGSVAATLDELATGDPLQITREVLLPVTFALIARAGTRLTSVRRVLTHPHAAAQCRRWLAQALPEAEVVAAASTAAAARQVAAGGPGREGADASDPRAGGQAGGRAVAAPADAAIAAPLAAQRYRLEVLADDIGDNSDAVTRFVLAGRPGVPPLATGRDKTTLVVFIAEGDRPGALLEVLTEFAVRGVNLTRIESRPTGQRLGTYSFSFDCEGHLADARVGEALAGLRRVCADVRFLGSYPRSDQRVHQGGDDAAVRPGASDRDFRDAAAWVAGLREGRI